MKPLALISTLGVLLLVTTTAALSQSEGVRKKRPLRHDYGNVVMDNVSSANDIAPVVFNHWLHRAKYTCRLCHVDLGFAMGAEETRVTEKDNRRGYYCGACHDGREAFGWEEKASAARAARKHCDRCHSYGKEVDPRFEFYEFTRIFPKQRFGSGVDWLKAQEQGLLKLKDHLKGHSIRRRPLADPKDAVVDPTVAEMPNIIFSHKKHAVWNGCELCHPDIFGVIKGSTRYTMQDIFAGKYCGACHGKVAFPNLDCQRCHTEL